MDVQINRRIDATHGCSTQPYSPFVTTPSYQYEIKTENKTEPLFKYQIRKVANGWILMAGVNEYVCIGTLDIAAKISELEEAQR